MVLGPQGPGRVGRRQANRKPLLTIRQRRFFCVSMKKIDEDKVYSNQCGMTRFMKAIKIIIDENCFHNYHEHENDY